MEVGGSINSDGRREEERECVVPIKFGYPKRKGC